MTDRVALLALLLLGPVPLHAPPGVLARCRVDKPPLAVWTLPHAAREISGLARTPKGLLLAHGDEKARLFAFEEGTGRLVKTFTLQGQPRDDFEGIAVDGSAVYLMTSSGRIYITAEGDDGATVPYQVVETGFGAQCELEGLAYDSANRVLLLPCKIPKTAELERRAVIFRWSLQRNAPAQPDRIVVEGPAIKALLGKAKFHQTSIEVDPASGHIVSLSSDNPGIIELTSDGKLVAATALSPMRHLQPEGITLAPGRLFVSDEGGKAGGTITVYGCTP